LRGIRVGELRRIPATPQLAAGVRRFEPALFDDVAG